MDHRRIDQFTTVTDGYVISDTSDDSGSSLVCGKYTFGYDLYTLGQPCDYLFEVTTVNAGGRDFLGDGSFEAPYIGSGDDRPAREAFARWLNDLGNA